MIKYICKKCNDFICESSICPICKNRTEVYEKSLFYCPDCDTISYYDTCSKCGNKLEVIGTDFRIVYPLERLLLEILLDKPFCFTDGSFYNLGANHYVYKGKKVNIKYKELSSKYSPDYIIDKLNFYEEENRKYVENFFETKSMKNFIEINRERLNSITLEASNYILENTKDKDESEMFVSFSGGKDSSVVSDLVLKTLDKKIIHIYGDTTLEYDTSELYIKRFRQSHRDIPLLVAKNKDQDFNNLCEVIGPPSRVNRWCCTVFKTGSITRKIESTFAGAKQIISFHGIRRNESNSRSKYDRTSTESKITKQVVLNPIIDWTDFDVWLYIMSNNLDINDAYKQGFSRVGCWCCPNNSSWSEFLSSIFMNEKFIKFRGILYKFARNVGKEDFKEYIDTGQWKKRQGGNGLSISKNSVVTFKPCALEEDTLNFDLTRDLTDMIYTLFKPFGILNFDMGRKILNEVYVLDRQSNIPLLKLQGRLGKRNLKVSILGFNKKIKDRKTFEIYIKNQINKFQTCLACSYCQAVCNFDALTVTNTEKGNVSRESVKYKIDENKCVGCLECVKHFANGCYLNRVLRIKKDDIND